MLHTHTHTERSEQLPPRYDVTITRGPSLNTSVFRTGQIGELMDTLVVRTPAFLKPHTVARASDVLYGCNIALIYFFDNQRFSLGLPYRNNPYSQGRATYVLLLPKNSSFHYAFEKWGNNTPPPCTVITTQVIQRRCVCTFLLILHSLSCLV